MIEELVGNYGDISALAILVGLMAWYLKYQTKQQTKREDKSDKERAERQDKRDKDQQEERDYYRTLIKNDLHKNVDLNNQSISLLKDISNNQGKLCKLIESVDRRINGRK